MPKKKVVRKKISKPDKRYVKESLYPAKGHIRTRVVSEDEEFNMVMQGITRPLVSEPKAKNFTKRTPGFSERLRKKGSKAKGRSAKKTPRKKH
jgi:hypothetical protein